jgi:small multidrug resistance pump
VSAGAWITAAIVLQVVGVTALRASQGLTRPVYAAAAFGGLVGSIVPVGRAIESGMSLAVAYSLWTGAGIACAAIGGAVLFGDALTRRQQLGLTLVLVGVVALESGR